MSIVFGTLITVFFITLVGVALTDKRKLSKREMGNHLKLRRD